MGEWAQAGLLTNQVGKTGVGQDIGNTLGISGAQGDYYQPGQQAPLEFGASNAVGDESARTNNAQASNIYSQYASGQNSLGDTLSNIDSKGASSTALLRGLATNPVAGSKLATDQVQGNSILGGLFGKGGQLDQSEQQYSDLAKNGFTLGADEMGAYGQQAGNISRLFGQQGNQSANDLASRGLSSSGAAGATFSGLAGNQNEMLNQAMNGIRQQKINDTIQRMQQTGSLMANLGQQGASAIQQQYDRQLQGVNQERGVLGAAAQAEAQRNAERSGQFGLDMQSQLASNEQKAAAKSPSLGQAFGAGLMGSASSFGSMPGKFGSSFAGSAGAGAGKAAGA